MRLASRALVVAIAVSTVAGIWWMYQGLQPTDHPAQVPEVETGAKLARRLFEEARRWIANGAPPITEVRDLTLTLDAKLDLEGVRHEGPLHLWLESPDRLRQERYMSGTLTAEILDGHTLYIRDVGGTFQEAPWDADGAASRRRAQADRERWTHLSRLMTLVDLDEPGVAFKYEGEKRGGGNFGRPGGDTWAKIVRQATGRPNIYLWLAHTKDAHGVMHATFPGVVRIDGTPMDGVPTEDFLLQDWREPAPGALPPYRFPRKLLAFQIRPGQQPLNFLTAIVLDHALNTGIDAARFNPK